METNSTLAYVSIDTKTWETVMFDTISAEQYMESKQMTTLSN